MAERCERWSSSLETMTTGPRSPERVARASQNEWKGGQRPTLRIYATKLFQYVIDGLNWLYNSNGFDRVKSMTSRRDWLLAAVSNGQDAGGLSPVQVQKIMFLFKQGAGKLLTNDYYIFEPYNYGPFCATIYRDLDDLITDGKVAEDRMPDRRWSLYQITVEGKSEAEKILASDDEPLIGFLEQTVRWVQEKSFPELLRAIYKKFPAYKINSVFST